MAFLFISSAAVVACNGILGLDGYRPCDGGECGQDAFADVAADGADAGCPVPTPPGHCCPTTPFGQPALLQATIDSPSREEGDLRFVSDPKGAPVGVVFYRDPDVTNVGQRQNMWMTMTSDGVNFDPPANAGDVNKIFIGTGDAALFSPTLSSDGLHVYFNTDAQSQPNLFHIWGSSRSATTNTFPVGAPLTVNGANSAPGDIDPYVVHTQTGDVLYFASSRGTINGSTRIYRAMKGGADFGAPVSQDPLVYDTYNAKPAVTPDELVAYFTSDNKIFMSIRASISDAWQTPVPVNELNTLTEQRSPSYISADRCTFYINAKASSTVILKATRSP